MAEPTFGQVYHTKDNKTVFVDPNTHQVSVFDDILTIDKILENTAQANMGVDAGMTDNEAITKLISHLTTPGVLVFDLVALPAISQQMGQQTKTEVDPKDIIDVKEYYVLVDEGAMSLSMGPSRARVWVKEYKNGHHPDYKGYRKHRIMPEQWTWLADHKECVVMTWLEPDCPIFAVVGCQDHAKIAKPVRHADNEQNGTTPLVTLETGTVQMAAEHVLSEERDI